MNILIINGSPKGKTSITLQTCAYIKVHNPKHRYAVLNAGSQIAIFERDFTKASKLINAADLIIFSYPVYTFLAPSQLHRFVDLMVAHSQDGTITLQDKYITQITTSKHFYDITAHAFIEDNMKDLGATVIRGLSADMDDLTKESGRKDALSFFKYVCHKISINSAKDITSHSSDKNVSLSHIDLSSQHTSLSCKSLKDVVVVADLAPNDDKLKEMITEFLSYTDFNAKLVNIHDFSFRGGCISCFNCSADGTCIYKDGFKELLHDEIQSGKAIVLAFSINNHSMGSVFKTYDDRQFCNGHRTVTMGMPFGYLVNGNLSAETNLKTVMEARAQVGGNYLAGIADNEFDMKKSVRELALDLNWCIENKYTQPANFYGVGGMKIFRDLIFEMQGFMKADYEFFKSHGQMDFPQKHPGKIAAMYLVGSVMNNPNIKYKLGDEMSKGMLMPYRKYIKCDKGDGSL